jgi:hypothetical protein
MGKWEQLVDTPVFSAAAPENYELVGFFFGKDVVDGMVAFLESCSVGQSHQ